MGGVGVVGGVGSVGGVGVVGGVVVPVGDVETAWKFPWHPATNAAANKRELSASFGLFAI